MKRSILMLLNCTQLPQKAHVMRLRSIFLALAVMLQFSSLALPASAQNPAAAPAAAGNLTGNWTVTATGIHFRSGVYQVKQVNNVVVGNTMPVLGQNAAQIDGTMRAGLVEGTWRGPTGESGWFNMRLSADGKAFSGQYGFNGRKAEGALVGHLAA
jgi:hypothetical protein